MKNLLTLAHDVIIIYHEKDFVGCTNVSQEGVGGILVQECWVVASESQKLKDHEKIYFSYGLELTAMVHALKVWRHYLMAKNFILMTDHSSLRKFFKQPMLNSKQVRWTTFLSEFDFDINHLKGKENQVVNALSRKVK